LVGTMKTMALKKKKNLQGQMVLKVSVLILVVNKTVGYSNIMVISLIGLGLLF